MIDYFGKNVNELKSKKLWFFDLDGTIYKDDKVFDGTIELLHSIENNKGKYVFITNNSSKSVMDYVKKVNKLGIKADESNFFTSAQATILWLKKQSPNSKVYCQGTKSLVKELKTSGINVTENVEPVDVVLIGFDLELTTEKIKKTCEILSTQNVRYIATNPDLACPVSFGFIPDCGSICQMIQNATGKIPTFFGKPAPTMIQYVIEKEKYTALESVIVGDRLYTDIASGLNAGITSICVLTGEATINEINNSTIKPSYTFESVNNIYDIIQRIV